MEVEDKVMTDFARILYRAEVLGVWGGKRLHGNFPI